MIARTFERTHTHPNVGRQPSLLKVMSLGNAGPSLFPNDM